METLRDRSDMPPLGIVGAGAVGTALGVAASRAGWPVTAVASRDEARRDRFRGLVPTARPFVDAHSLLEAVPLVVLAVPDEAIALVAESVRLYAGQSMVHTSGLLGKEVLAPALTAGTQVGAFHPLVSVTSDVEASVAAFSGATMALDADEPLMSLLADLAEAVGGVPVRLPPGSKPAYHAAAVFASGGLIALLDAIVTLAAGAGMDERTAVAVYGRLMKQTLANAEAGGVQDSLTGPIVRGDADTIAAHLAALEAVAPEIAALYLAAARRELEIAQRRGTLSPAQADRVLAALAKGA